MIGFRLRNRSVYSTDCIILGAQDGRPFVDQTPEYIANPLTLPSDIHGSPQDFFQRWAN